MENQPILGVVVPKLSQRVNPGQKRCINCGSIKETTEFYAHPQNRDGLQGRCKACMKAKPGARAEMKEDARYRATRLRTYRHCEFPEIAFAERKTRDRRGRVLDHVLHHWSYREEHALDVIPVRKGDHARIHRNMTYDRNAKQYRSLKIVPGIPRHTLLDSKELHCAYLNLLVGSWFKRGPHGEMRAEGIRAMSEMLKKQEAEGKIPTLAYCSFVYGMTPKEYYEKYPEVKSMVDIRTLRYDLDEKTGRLEPRRPPETVQPEAGK
jgi:hypothetical protein